MIYIFIIDVEKIEDGCEDMLDKAKDGLNDGKLITNNIFIIKFFFIAKDKFEEKCDEILHPGETKFEKYVRKTKEYFEDLKDSAVNNFNILKEKITN